MAADICMRHVDDARTEAGIVDRDLRHTNGEQGDEGGSGAQTNEMKAGRSTSA